jgi:hypothetical protein
MKNVFSLVQHVNNQVFEFSWRFMLLLSLIIFTLDLQAQKNWNENNGIKDKERAKYEVNIYPHLQHNVNPSGSRDLVRGVDITKTNNKDSLGTVNLNRLKDSTIINAEGEAIGNRNPISAQSIHIDDKEEVFNMSSASAPTITNATFPIAGDTLRFAIDYFPTGLVPFTPPGGPQEWDFTSLQTDENKSIIFRPASEGSQAASVLGAELFTVESPNTESYYNVTPTRFELQAYWGITPYALV